LRNFSSKLRSFSLFSVCSVPELESFLHVSARDAQIPGAKRRDVYILYSGA